MVNGQATGQQIGRGSLDRAEGFAQLCSCISNTLLLHFFFRSVAAAVMTLRRLMNTNNPDIEFNGNKLGRTNERV